MIYFISVLVVFTFLFPLSVSADKPVGIIRDFSFESNVVTKVHDFNKPDSYGQGSFGIVESMPGDGHSGSQCIHLRASSIEYSNVYSKVKGPVDLDEILDVSFWYKHLPDSPGTTPYLVLWFELYDGGFLGAVQSNQQFFEPKLEWTLFDADVWNYYVFNSDWVLIDYSRDPVRFVTIKDLFDGELIRNEASVGIAVGYDRTGCDVLVDDISIITIGNLKQLYK